MFAAYYAPPLMIAAEIRRFSLPPRLRRYAAMLRRLH